MHHSHIINFILFVLGLVLLLTPPYFTVQANMDAYKWSNLQNSLFFCYQRLALLTSWSLILMVIELQPSKIMRHVFSGSGWRWLYSLSLVAYLCHPMAIGMFVFITESQYFLSSLSVLIYVIMVTFTSFFLSTVYYFIFQGPLLNLAHIVFAVDSDSTLLKPAVANAETERLLQVPQSTLKSQGLFEFEGSRKNSARTPLLGLNQRIPTESSGGLFFQK